MHYLITSYQLKPYDIPHSKLEKDTKTFHRQNLNNKRTIQINSTTKAKNKVILSNNKEQYK